MTIEDASVLEGTWEELLAHADELRGHRLRLIVLPSRTGSGEMTLKDESALRDRTLELFKEADSIVREPGKSGNGPYDENLGELLEDKYRKIGLKL